MRGLTCALVWAQKERKLIMTTKTMYVNRDVHASHAGTEGQFVEWTGQWAKLSIGGEIDDWPVALVKFPGAERAYSYVLTDQMGIPVHGVPVD